MISIDFLTQWKDTIKDFHPDSRAWIYQCSRELVSEEVEKIQQELDSFVIQWTAHGSQLTAKAFVLYSRFILLVADESRTTASGCSIDSSVHFIKSIENTFKISLFDRTNIAFLNDENAIKTIHFSQVKAALSTGSITGETLIFDNSIASRESLFNNWIIPLKNSWLNKYL